MKLEGRIAVVTGAGSGIGRAIAQSFVAEGALVCVSDLVIESAQITVDRMGPLREKAFPIRADVSDSAQVMSMFAEVERRYGTVDILVNNAGIGTETADAQHKFETQLQERIATGQSSTHLDITQAITDQAWHRMIGVHLNGTFFCTREALKLMSRKNRGVIINLSSVAALNGIPYASHYGAAKGGILAFTRSLALEVASRNIRVNAICPGFIATSMMQRLPFKGPVMGQVPMARWGEPDDVAAAALFLASDDSSYFTGQWLSPNGGLFTG